MALKIVENHLASVKELFNSHTSHLARDYATYAFLRRYKNEYKYQLQIVELLPKVLYNGGVGLISHTSEDLNGLYTDIDVLEYTWFGARNVLRVMKLYEVYDETFIGHALDAYRPSTKLLVERLDTSHKGMDSWFRDWLEK